MRFSEIKTASDLKYMLPEDSHFFSRSTMRFFGDTMANYGIKKHWEGGRLVIELRRKKPVKMGNTSSHYFWLENGLVKSSTNFPTFEG